MMPIRQAAWRGKASISLMAIACAMCLSGCVTETKPLTPGIPSAPSPRGTPHPVTVGPNGKILDPIDNPSGYTFSLDLRAEHLPLGSVPFDGFTLPLVSPDGRYVATQTNTPPEWPTLLAEPGAVPPTATTIQVYALDAGPSTSAEPRQAPQLVATVSVSALLGRGCDGEGFLIEAPQVDGSRWIGKASWGSAEVQWLVQDVNVNAFAALAPDGRLAWSRRAIDAPHFDMAVRDAGGSTWIVPNGGGDWLMPVWPSFGDGLYAMHRENKHLRLCFGQPTSQGMFTATLRDFTLIAESDKYAAYQAFINQGSLDGMVTGTQPALLALHPGIGRVIIWKPLAPKSSAATLLNARSLVALQQTSDSVLICTRSELLLQSLKKGDANIVLNKGLWIPRRTPRWTLPFMLLSPGEGRVFIEGIGLVRPEPVAPPQPSTAKPHA